MLVTQLTSVGLPVDDEERCQILLCSLPNSWDSLVMAIGSTLVVLKMEDVVGSLLSEEMRRKVSLNAKDALSFHGRPRERGRNKKQHGHSKSKNKGDQTLLVSPRQSARIVANLDTFERTAKRRRKRRRRSKILILSLRRKMEMLSSHPWPLMQVKMHG